MERPTWTVEIMTANKTCIQKKHSNKQVCCCSDSEPKGEQKFLHKCSALHFKWYPLLPLFKTTHIHIHVYTLISPAGLLLTLSFVVGLPVVCPPGFSLRMGASSVVLKGISHALKAVLQCACTPYTDTKYTLSPEPTYMREEVSLLLRSGFCRNIKEENRKSTYETGLKCYFSVQWPDSSLMEALYFNVTSSPQTDTTLSGPRHPTIWFSRQLPMTHMLML